MIIQSWDMAFKDSDGSAKVAGYVMGRSGPNVYVFDLVNEKMSFTQSVKAVRDMTAKWPKARAKVVEDKANGPAVMDVLGKEVSGLVPFNPRGSKEERAISATPYFEAGNVFFPDPNTASWVTDLQKDLLMFPKGVYKDTVDALVQGILYLMDKPSQTGPPAETVAGGMSSYWRGK